MQLNNSFEEIVYVEVLLPLPLPNTFTYSCSKEWFNYIKKGARIVVPFGKKRILTGIILNHSAENHSAFEARPIIDILDAEPSIVQSQLTLFFWIAEYYLCHPGEVLQAALPSGLKLHTESFIQLNPFANINYATLTEAERLVIDYLQTKEYIKYDQLFGLTGRKSIQPLIKSLLSKEIILLIEDYKEKFKPKTLRKIRLKTEWTTSVSIELLVNSLEKNPKQLDVLLYYIKETNLLSNFQSNVQGVSRKDALASGLSESSIRTLIDKGIFEEFDHILSRFNYDEATVEAHSLSDIQITCRDSILSQFDQYKNVVLHGITGSGKTEIYIDLIQTILDQGRQALYLLPEIALTTQIVSRLQKVFGDKLGIYHSKFSDNERVETWKGIIEGRFQVVIGVRSAVLLPFSDLGLIIVDEEHDGSYKQQDPAPRYHARDTAIMLGHIHHGKVLLGTATPSIETYFQCQEQKWGYVSLDHRHGEAVMPNIIFQKLSINEKKANAPIGNFLSTAIVDKVRSKEQVLLFQNRRGYAPYLCCDDCNTIPTCPDCAVSLTLHQEDQSLRCHYCGYKQKTINKCESCGSHKLLTRGAGTERIEEDIKLLIPEANVGRMDLDTTRKKNAHSNLIEQLSSGDLDILVGTQMITKGLDFDKVTLVGVTDADGLLNFPDFRAPERTYQTLTQVAGRAGRKQKLGTVIIQTSDPEIPIYQFVAAGNYKSFYAHEIKERETFNYPPFSRLIKITIKHTDKRKAATIAQLVARNLTSKLGPSRIKGPEEPIVYKIRNQYLFQILIKLERQGLRINDAKQFISTTISDIQATRSNHDVRFVIDVDPV